MRITRPIKSGSIITILIFLAVTAIVGFSPRVQVWAQSVNKCKQVLVDYGNEGQLNNEKYVDGDTNLFDCLSSLNFEIQPTGPSNVKTTGSRLILLKAVSFSDNSNYTTQPDLLVDLLDQADDYIFQNSYGKAWLVRDDHPPVVSQGVVDWKSLDIEAPPGCPHPDGDVDSFVVSLIEQALAEDSDLDNVIDYRVYDDQIVGLLIPAIYNCGYYDVIGSTRPVDISTPDGKIKASYIFWIDQMLDDREKYFSFIQALGSTYGLSGANVLECYTHNSISYENCNYFDKWDPFDVMGLVPDLHWWHLNAIAKTQLGWLNESNMAEISDRDSGQYNLQPLSASETYFRTNGGISGIRFLKINILDSPGKAWTIEYRDPATDPVMKSVNPNAIGNEPYKGASIRLADPDSTNGPSYLVDSNLTTQGDYLDAPLKIGESLTTTDPVPVKITVCSQDQNGLSVAVNQECINFQDLSRTLPVVLKSHLPQKNSSAPVVIHHSPGGVGESGINGNLYPGMTKISEAIITVLENNGYRGPTWNNSKIPVNDWLRNYPDPEYFKYIAVYDDLVFEFFTKINDTIQAVRQDSRSNQVILLGYSSGGVFMNAVYQKGGFATDPNVYLITYGIPAEKDRLIDLICGPGLHDGKPCSGDPKVYYWEHPQDPLATTFTAGYLLQAIGYWLACGEISPYLCSETPFSYDLGYHFYTWDLVEDPYLGTIDFSAGIKDGMTLFLNKHFPPKN